jgi:hypothetical protein
MPGVRRPGTAPHRAVDGRQPADGHLSEVQTRLAPRLRTLKSRRAGGVRRLVGRSSRAAGSIVSHTQRHLARQFAVAAPEPRPRPCAFSRAAARSPAILPPAPIGLDLPDPDDWPIIATAIVGRASTILTYDRGHFPLWVLGPYGLRAQHPDRWCADLVRSSEDVAADVYAGLRDQLADLKKPAPWTPEQYRAKPRELGFVELESRLPADGSCSTSCRTR